MLSLLLSVTYEIAFYVLLRSAETIIRQMRDRHLPDDDFSDDSILSIQVRRKKIWKDTLRAFKQPRFTPRKWLKVEFIGEAAIDDGGPRREFFRWGMQEICHSQALFQGTSNARVPTHNVHLLCNHEYRYMGIFFAMSILQGGPAPTFMAPTIAHYLLHGNVGLQARITDIPDPEIQAKLRKVRTDVQIDNKENCVYTLNFGEC